MGFGYYPTTPPAYTHTMLEKKFWKTIEALELEIDYDLDRIREELQNLFEESELEDLYKEFCRAQHDLRSAYGTWCREFGDLIEPDPRTFRIFDLVSTISDVIAHGEKEYYKCLNFPRNILDRLEEEKILEDFGNVWKG